MDEVYKIERTADVYKVHSAAKKAPREKKSPADSEFQNLLGNTKHQKQENMSLAVNEDSEQNLQPTSDVLLNALSVQYTLPKIENIEESQKDRNKE